MCPSFHECKLCRDTSFVAPNPFGVGAVLAHCCKRKTPPDPTCHTYTSIYLLFMSEASSLLFTFCYDDTCIPYSSRNVLFPFSSKQLLRRGQSQRPHCSHQTFVCTLLCCSKADVGTPGICASHPHQDPQLSSPLTAVGGQDSASHAGGSRHSEVDQRHSSWPHRWAAGRTILRKEQSRRMKL